MSGLGVVIPLRDGAPWIEEALDSLERQRPRCAEVVVVDDRSTDDGVARVRARGVRVIASPQPGAGAARNAGVAALTTPLLAFLDADDRLTPDHHHVLLAAVADADLARGHVRQFATDAAAARRFAIPEGSLPGGVAGAIVVRRAAFEAVGGFGADGMGHEHFDLLTRLADSGARAVDVDDVVLERRIHGRNWSIVRRAELHAQYLASARAAIERRRG